MELLIEKPVKLGSNPAVLEAMTLKSNTVDRSTPIVWLH